MTTILDMLRQALSAVHGQPLPPVGMVRAAHLMAVRNLRNAIGLLELGYPITANADTLLDLRPVEEVPYYQPPVPPASTTPPSVLADLEARVKSLESCSHSIEHRLSALKAAVYSVPAIDAGPSRETKPGDVFEAVPTPSIHDLDNEQFLPNPTATYLANGHWQVDCGDMQFIGSVEQMALHFGLMMRENIRLSRMLKFRLAATDTTTEPAATPGRDPSPSPAVPA